MIENPTKMAPVLSKICMLKNGKKIPINSSNLKAVVTLTKKLTTKRVPQRYVPEPGPKRVENGDSDEENDEELQGLLRDAEASRRERNLPVIPEVEPEVESEIELELIPTVPPPVDPPRDPAAGPPNPNLESIFKDGDYLEPNLELSEISESHRAEILLYPGSDTEKRKQYYWKYYPDYARYYEMFDCWNESCIKSKHLPCGILFDPVKCVKEIVSRDSICT